MLSDAPPAQPAAATGDTASPDAAIAAEREPRPISLWSLCGLALGMGIFTGFGAVLFRELIGFVHNLLFLGRPAFAYDASVFTPPIAVGRRWSSWCRCSARIGVTFIVTTFAPEAKGHGVPEVMDAIYYRGGVIRPVVAVVKSLASALAIGSGAAVGREGPIIQIGSALGSTLGQLIRMPAGPAHHAGRRRRRRRHRRDLQHADRRRAVRDRADAARGQRQHVPAGRRSRPARRRSSAGCSSARSRPSAVPRDTRRHAERAEQRAHAAALRAARRAHRRRGALASCAALHLAEDLLRPHPRPLPAPRARHAAGRRADVRAADRALGHYYVEGVGYATIQAILHGQLAGAWLPAAAVRLQAVRDLGQPRLGLLGRHLLAVAVHGRDARRGLRAPRRRCFSRLAARALPAFAMVGMGAMVGGGTGAAMTAVDDDLRDDARLRHRAADDPRRRAQPRRAARAVAARTSTR